MLSIKNLKTVFDVHNQTITAVDSINYDIPKRSIIGLVGESGSGKSVSCLSLLGLLPKNAHVSGEALWNGQNLIGLDNQRLTHIRGKEIGIIFQNPQAALNPVFSVGNQMVETIRKHHNIPKYDAEKMAIDLLEKVNIPDAKRRLGNYPHEFSQGMCQRVMIAMTLSMRPKLLIADEPTASLDVTVAAQILALMDELKDEFDMSILMISHDLGVIAQHADNILIMYLGKIVEKGQPRQIFRDPKHPYTQALIQAIPSPNPDIKNETPLLKGELPSPFNIPKGCRFHTRCPKVMPHCKTSQPSLQSVDDTSVACFLYD